MALSESEAREENARSLRSIAVSQQVQALILLRNFSELNFEFIEKDNLEITIQNASVGALEI